MPLYAVSVVVTARRSADSLRRCLSALLKQTLPPERWELIVVDDSRGDAARRAVLDAAQNTPVRIRYFGSDFRKGCAAARNIGWEEAAGRCIAFTDEDCIPDERWLETIVDARKNGVFVGWGRVVVPLPARPTEYERHVSRLERTQFSAANCFITRDLLEAAGGFDERFTCAGAEARDLFLTLSEAGVRPVALPGARVLHPIPPAGWGVSVGLQSRGMFDALLYKKHPDLYRKAMRDDLPLALYGNVAALCAALLAASFGSVILTLVALTTWAYLALGFTMRRLEETSHEMAHVAEVACTSVIIPPLAVFWRVYGALKFRVVIL